MAANQASAVQQAFNKLFTTLTPDQVQNFRQYLQEATDSNASTTNNVAAVIPPITNDPASIQKSKSNVTHMTMAAPVSSPMAANTVPRTPPSRKKRVRENGKLRPLNSFIAFRSFYSIAFPDLSQKIKSGLLRLLWTSDPFKAKWAILAKAYSIIRDSHSGEVNLESFLALNGPLIGIVGPNDYLRVMGLQLAINMDKQFSVIKTNHHAGPTQADLTTNLSVDDIVTHCYQAGYVAGVLPPNNNNHGIGVAMAVAVLPSDTHYPQSYSPRQRDTSSPPSSRTIHVRSPKRVIQKRDPIIESETGNAENRAVNASGVGAEPNNGKSLLTNSAMTLPNGNLDCVDPATDGPYTAEDFDRELRTAMGEFPIAPDDNGYFTLFNPELHNPVYIYNPYCVQSDFDPYDIGSYIDL
ncbi:hypothetical protein AJ78_01298 [Emergomyces pasteurianus Ep9510]|uniref:Alpha box domain-containing protein n=1 Tax=Emergomyces pasteurianus Ep9510 TaxID=1447872 RepID=A0A1J9QER1_9EURO|nr:hypothetical protein AJ78_01298 [Emergomyces pasteurianus Ep9510]